MKHMKKHLSKIVSLLLVALTLVSVFAIPASAALGYPMDCTIYYKSESGSTLASPKTFSVSASDSSAGSTGFSSPSISGYSLKNSGDSFVSYSMMDKKFPASNYVRKGTATYTVYYVKNQSTTIYYKYANGNTASSAKTVSGNPSSSFSVTSPSITGYTPSKTTCTGTYGSASQTVYYYEKTYTLSYNANGGNGAPSTQTKRHFTDLTISTTTPTRTGYTFLGWGTYASDTTVNYSPGDSYTSNYNQTLYAIWKGRTYTVSYNANGGTGAPASQTKTYGQTLTLSSKVPTRSGYEFVGWATTSSATSASYSPGGSLTRNSNVTLYAVWEKIPDTYTVRYNANGGSGAPSSQTKTEGVNLTLSSIKPTRDGYTFVGWGTSSGTTSVSYYAGGTYSRDTSITLYAIWTPTVYTITYNANGGSNAPSSQTKTHGQAITLTNAAPTRSNYAFMGWATSSSATSPEYYGGERYSADASVTLYAVWVERNYDFSASGLTVAPNDVKQYEKVTISFRMDSWDRNLSYSGIPVEVLLNGSVIYSTSVDFAKYGVQYVSFDLNVGALHGSQTITARVNWSDHNSETRTGNNSVTTTFSVTKLIETSVSNVAVNGDYIEGFEVITSFYAVNDAASDILPSDGVSFDFTVYTLNGNTEAVIDRQTWSNVVIPSGGKNLVYFKWRVPEGSAGTTYFCKGTVNSAKMSEEDDSDNNTVEFSVMAKSLGTSQTPNTRYEDKAPSGYSPNATAPANKIGNASWNMWVYENGSLVLKNYGITISNSVPVVAPSASCTTAIKNGNRWKMGSGYGITLTWDPTVSQRSGYLMPSANAYTKAQYAYATMPEYAYSTASGKFRTLEYANGAYRFIPNIDASNNERIHFIPVYVQDGNYTISSTATQIWTPAGMLSVTQKANPIVISGTMYDDLYVGN